jgi:hypothetical protein
MVLGHPGLRTQAGKLTNPDVKKNTRIPHRVRKRGGGRKKGGRRNAPRDGVKKSGCWLATQMVGLGERNRSSTTATSKPACAARGRTEEGERGRDRTGGQQATARTAADLSQAEERGRERDRGRDALLSHTHAQSHGRARRSIRIRLLPVTRRATPRR